MHLTTGRLFKRLIKIEDLIGSPRLASNLLTRDRSHRLDSRELEKASYGDMIISSLDVRQFAALDDRM